MHDPHAYRRPDIEASGAGTFGVIVKHRATASTTCPRPPGQLHRPGITASYAYNGRGERVSKTVNATVTHFRYANRQLIGEYDDSGNAIREYVYLNGQPLALITSGNGGGPSTFVVDGQGLSPRPNLLTIVPATQQMTYRDAEGVDHPILFGDVGSYWIEHITNDDLRHISFQGHANLTPLDRLKLSGRVLLDTTAHLAGEVATDVRRGHTRSFNDGDNQHDTVQFEAYGDEIHGDVSWRFDVANRQVTFSTTHAPPVVFTASAPTDRWVEQVNGDISSIHFSIDGPGNSQLRGVRLISPGLIHSSVTHIDSIIVEILDLTTVRQVQSGAGEQVLFVHTDHLGAAATLTDAQANVAWAADRLPFGRVAINTAQLDMPLRFPGQYYDDESGLHYNYFRDYDPTTGRYIQSDPIGLAGGFNTYEYAKSNPLYWTDPLGLNPGAATRAFQGLAGMLSRMGRPTRPVAPPVIPPGGLPPGHDVPDIPAHTPIDPPIVPIPPIPMPNEGSGSTSGSSAEECEKECDLEWDRNKFLCDSMSGANHGFKSKAYKTCLERIDRIYIECIQDCAKACK